jgi:uncharacterized membrane protein
MSRHFVRCLIAGTVALLPVGGAVLTVVYLEYSLAGWWPERWFYFPGLGLLFTVALLYGVGLLVTTFLGRWLWRRLDAGLGLIPVFGGVYQTLKQILGYGGGKGAVFQRVVLVPSTDTGGVQLGLVTNQTEDGRWTVFLPGSPNPTAGRLVMVDAAQVTPLESDVADALKTLVSVGKGEVLR